MIKSDVGPDSNERGRDGEKERDVSQHDGTPRERQEDLRCYGTRRIAVKFRRMPEPNSLDGERCAAFLASAAQFWFEQDGWYGGRPWLVWRQAASMTSPARGTPGHAAR